MKKQYHTSYAGFRRTRIDIYHDGIQFSTETFWDDEGDAQIKHLEEQGYTRGFTMAEVESAEKFFKKVQNNLIEGAQTND